MIDQDKAMKFRAPKTGEVFEDITDYIWRYTGCKNSCPEQCAIGRKAEAARMPCATYVRAHPAEAARLMGYEVVEDHVGDTTEKVRPRICEVLGVEVGERFIYPGMTGEFYITENGTLISVDDGSEHPMMCASTLINCPDRIIRKLRFSEEEVAIAQGLYRVWPDGKLLRRAPDDLVLTSYHYGFAMPVPQDMFSGLRNGQSVALADIVGGEP